MANRTLFWVLLVVGVCFMRWIHRHHASIILALFTSQSAFSQALPTSTDVQIQISQLRAQLSAATNQIRVLQIQNRDLSVQLSKAQTLPMLVSAQWPMASTNYQRADDFCKTQNGRRLTGVTTLSFPGVADPVGSVFTCQLVTAAPFP